MLKMTWRLKQAFPRLCWKSKLLVGLSSPYRNLLSVYLCPFINNNATKLSSTTPYDFSIQVDNTLYPPSPDRLADLVRFAGDGLWSSSSSLSLRSPTPSSPGHGIFQPLSQAGPGRAKTPGLRRVGCE